MTDSPQPPDDVGSDPSTVDVGPLHPRTDMQGPQVGRLGDRRLPGVGTLPYAPKTAAPVERSGRGILVPAIAAVAVGGAIVGAVAVSANGGDGEVATRDPRTELIAPATATQAEPTDPSKDTTMASPSAPSASPGETTAAPTTDAPTTDAPTTAAPTTSAPTTTTAPAPAEPAPEVPADDARPTVPGRTTLAAEARFVGGRLVLTGALPDQRIADALTRKAATVVGAENVVDGFSIDPTAPIPEGLPVVVAEQVRYGFDSSEVGADQVGLVQTWKDVLDAFPGVRMRITGYTDSIGDPAYNQALSVERAQAVAGWMEARGIDASRFVIDGKGAADPIADNGTDAGRAANRRIQVTLDGLLMA